MTHRKPLPVIWTVLGLLVAVGPALASEISSNLWEFSKHYEEGGALTITATLLDLKNPPPGYNPRAPGGFDDHGYGRDLSAPAKLVFNSGYSHRVGTKFTAGYYRGSLYRGQGSRPRFRGPGAEPPEDVSIFSNRDRHLLIVAMDSGLVYTSTNSGLTWTMITTPGVHHQPLSTSPDGGGLYAQDRVKATVSAAPIAGGTNSPILDWYAVASSPDGSKLVVTGDGAQPAPALNIRYSKGEVTIVWPATCKDFVLEHKTDLGSGTWAAITNAVLVVGPENRVEVPSAIGSHFFRLRHQ